MKVLLLSGCVVYIPAAKQMVPINRDKEMEFQTARGRVVATFTVANIVGWWWNNENVSVKSPQTKPDVPQSPAGGNGR